MDSVRSAFQRIANIRGHPFEERGWWCGHSDIMMDTLFVFAVKPSPKTNSFLKRMALQLSSCRQCTKFYIRAKQSLAQRVSELSSQDLNSIILRLRKWDIERLLKRFKSEGNSHTTMRETALEALSSAELCMHKEIMHEVCSFLSKTPLSIQDVIEFASGLDESDKYTLAGIPVFCTLVSGQAQRWACDVIENSTQVLRGQSRGLGTVVDAAICCIALNASDSVAVELPTKGLVLICRYFRANKWASNPSNRRKTLNHLKCIIQRGCRVAVEVALQILQLFLSVSKEELCKTVATTFESALSWIRTLRDAYEGHFEIEKIQHGSLEILTDLFDMLPWASADNVTKLTNELFPFLQKASKRPSSLVESRGIKVFGESNVIPKTYVAARRASINLIMEAYRFSAPCIPFEKSEILCQAIISLIQDKSLTKEVTPMLATVLLTDARNVLRSIVGNDKACAIMKVVGPAPLELKEGDDGNEIFSRYLANMISNCETISSENQTYPWLYKLWIFVGSVVKSKTPFHKLLSEETRKAILGITLEVHRILGFVSPSHVLTCSQKFEFSGQLSTQVFTASQCLSAMTKACKLFLENEKHPTDSWHFELFCQHLCHMMASESLDFRRVSFKALSICFGLRGDVRSDHLVELCKLHCTSPEVSKKVVQSFVNTSRMLALYGDYLSLKSIVYHSGHYRALLRAGMKDAFESQFSTSESSDVAETELNQMTLLNLVLCTMKNWKKIRSTQTTDYSENMVRFLKIIPSIYEEIVIGDMSSNMRDANSDDRIRLITVIIEFGKHQSSQVQKAWLLAIVQLMKKNKPSKANQASIRDFIERSMKSSCGLEREQLQILAKTFELTVSLSEFQAGKLNSSVISVDQSAQAREERQLTKMEKLRLEHMKMKTRKSEEETEKSHLQLVKSHGAALREQAVRALEKTLRPLEPKPDLKNETRKPKLGLLTREERSVDLRDIVDFYNDLLRDLQLGECRHQLDNPTRRSTFACAEEYVRYWWAILIIETSASVRPEIDAEERHFCALLTDESKDFIRAPFILAKNVDNERGSLYKMTLKYSGQGRLKDNASFSQPSMNKDYLASRLQVNDIAHLEIGNSKEGNNGSRFKLLGVVTELATKGMNTTMTVMIRRSERGLPASGCKVKVGRITSVVSHTRLFYALAGVSALPEIFLRTLLNPQEGWTIACELKRRTIGHSSRFVPLDSAVKNLVSMKALNRSQAQSISNVVLRTGKSYKPNCHLDQNGALVSGAPPNRFKNRGSLSLIQGPPGTGKTSTILGLLSVLLANEKGSIRGPLQQVRSSEGEYFSVAPFRILVCAPSNAAVDEVLKRLLEKGLLMPDGNRACPRAVRIGAGCTVQELGQVEIKSLAMQDPEWSFGRSEAENSVLSNVREQSALIRETGQKIKDIHEKRDSVKKALASAIGADENKLRADMNKFSDELTNLHRHKETLGSKLSKLKATLDDNFDDRRKSNTKVLSRVLNSASVVFSTLNASGQDVMRHLLGTFNVVIIDEAAQCIEPDVLIPFTGMCVKNAKALSNSRAASFAMRSSSQHCVMVGDPNQLPATVLSSNRLVVDAGSTSFFERSADTSVSEVHLLNVQYRMHPIICQFPSIQFYGGRLLCGPNVVERRYHRAYHLDKLRRFGPLSLLDTDNCSHTMESRSSKTNSSFNEGEARIIQIALVTLFRCYPFEYLSGEVAVLTPYSAQVSLIRRMINERSELREADITVSTVDGIQGREKPFVFLSTVRDGTSRGIGFVKDRRRMNVAMTRPQYSLVVVGNAKALKSGSDDWGSFVAHCTAMDAILKVPDCAGDLFPEFVNGKFTVANKIQEKTQLVDLRAGTQDWEVDEPSDNEYNDESSPDFDFDEALVGTISNKSSQKAVTSNILVPLTSQSDLGVSRHVDVRKGPPTHTSSDGTHGFGTTASSSTRSSGTSLIRSGVNKKSSDLTKVRDSSRSTASRISKSKTGSSSRSFVKDDQLKCGAQEAKVGKPSKMHIDPIARSRRIGIAQSVQRDDGKQPYRPLTASMQPLNGISNKRTVNSIRQTGGDLQVEERSLKRLRRMSTDSDLVEISARGPRVASGQVRDRSARSIALDNSSRRALVNPLVQQRNNRLLQVAQALRTQQSSSVQREGIQRTNSAGSAKLSRTDFRPGESSLPARRGVRGSGKNGSVEPERQDGRPKRQGFSLADALKNAKKVSQSVARARGER